MKKQQSFWFGMGFWGVCLLVFFQQVAVAHNRVVVVPLLGDDVRPMANIITVSAQNGDFTDPVAAVNSITDASAGNPYLVMIGPGVYTLTQPLRMKPFVSVSGAGIAVTTLRGAISHSFETAESAIVVGANDAELSDMTIINSGGNSYSFGVVLGTVADGGVNTKLRRLDITAFGSSFVSGGIYNVLGSDTIIEDVSTYASGSNFSYGVFISASSPNLNRVHLISRVPDGSTATAIGLGVSTSAYPAVRYSILEGATNAVHVRSASSATISFSTLVGNAEVDGGSAWCLHSVSGYNTLNSGCTLP